MPEKNFNLRDLISYSAGGILSKVIIKNGKMDVTLFCMAGGTEISEHTSTKKGFVYIIEGVGVFYLQGKKIEMSPGVFIQMAEDMVHSIKAEENLSFLLTLIK